MITITIQITQDKDGGFSVNLGTPEQPTKKPNFQQFDNTIAFDTIDDDDDVVPFDED